MRRRVRNSRYSITRISMSTWDIEKKKKNRLPIRFTGFYRFYQSARKCRLIIIIRITIITIIITYITLYYLYSSVAHPLRAVLRRVRHACYNIRHPYTRMPRQLQLCVYVMCTASERTPANLRRAAVVGTDRSAYTCVYARIYTTSGPKYL